MPLEDEFLVKLHLREQSLSTVVRSDDRRHYTRWTIYRSATECYFYNDCTDDIKWTMESFQNIFVCCSLINEKYTQMLED